MSFALKTILFLVFITFGCTLQKDLIHFESPNKEIAVQFKKQNNDLNSVIFNGGEEYEFVFTIPSKYKKIIIKSAKLLKTPIIEIGYVTFGKGVYLENQGKKTLLKDLGWKHFK